jgi:hypothetical protein
LILRIDIGGSSWANAFVLSRIVDISIWTRVAGFAVGIPPSGKDTSNALTVGIKIGSAGRADALFIAEDETGGASDTSLLSLVVPRVSWAGLTGSESRVPEVGYNASNAFVVGSNKISLWRTEAGKSIWVEDVSIRAACLILGGKMAKSLGIQGNQHDGKDKKDLHWSMICQIILWREKNKIKLNMFYSRLPN